MKKTCATCGQEHEEISTEEQEQQLVLALKLNKISWFEYFEAWRKLDGQTGNALGCGSRLR